MTLSCPRCEAELYLQHVTELMDKRVRRDYLCLCGYLAYTMDNGVLHSYREADKLPGAEPEDKATASKRYHSTQKARRFEKIMRRKS